jgi:hypothetical protein
MEFIKETLYYGIILGIVEVILIIISSISYNNIDTSDPIQTVYSFLKFIFIFMCLNVVFIGILNYR